MLSLPGCLRVVYIRCVIADKCWHETETLRVWMDVAYKPAQNEVSERGWTSLWAVSPPHHLWVGSPFTPLMCGAAIKDTEAQRAAHPLPAVQLHPQLFLLLWFQTGCYRPACGIRTGRLCMSVCVCVCHCMFAERKTDLLERANRLLLAAAVFCSDGNCQIILIIIIQIKTATLH